MLRGECRRLAPRLSATVDRGASDLELQRHLRTCGRCRRRSGQYRRLAGMVRNVGAVELGRAVAEARRRRRRRRQALGGALGGTLLAGVVAAVSSRRRRTT